MQSEQNLSLGKVKKTLAASERKEGQCTENTPPVNTPAKRPRSLTIISLFFLIFFGLSYAAGLFMLATEDNGKMLCRMVVEPPEEKGGIPFPGWGAISDSMRGKSRPVNEYIAAKYWWAKMKQRGSFLFGPVLIIGWLGVYYGRRWGRVLLYVYTATWLANNVVYLFLLGVDGVFKFSVAVGTAVLLILALRSKSWSRWIERPELRPPPASGSTMA